MPRTRRRHHSRSRTRSRSHSYERDREPKRRKLESYESPQNKSSLSQEENDELSNSTSVSTNNDSILNSSPVRHRNKEDIATNQTPIECDTLNSGVILSNINDNNQTSDVSNSVDLNNSIAKSGNNKGLQNSKTSSPNQTKKKLELENREEKHKERERKKHEILDEKLKVKEKKQKLRDEKEQKKQKEKQEKQEQKQKEFEEKQKEREIKEEQKKKERQEKEKKRKEKEDKNEQKRKDLEEKHKEKQKEVEKKQKAAAAFANFFTKKIENQLEEKKTEENILSSTFMPFAVKSDMILAPIIRNMLTSQQKINLLEALQNQESNSYLSDLKRGKRIGRSGKTWPADQDMIDDEEDIIIIDANPGESIEDQSKSNIKTRAKFFKFADNRRPAYFGTWRKKSKFITPRKPLALDKEYFDYEIDSDEDWEEGEDTGESLHGSDDEDKENESDNEYEVDNEFFVPHGHLSDDEVNDEEDVNLSPEAHKAKLKLLKKEFDEDMQGKTHKIKPRVVGCIWYKKSQKNVDSTIHEFLKPLSIISNGPVLIKNRNEFLIQTPLRRSTLSGKLLSNNLVPDFLKLIHGNTNGQKVIVSEFINYLNSKDINMEVSKTSLSKQLKHFAAWTRCLEDGPMLNKYCWRVHDSIKDEYNIK